MKNILFPDENVTEDDLYFMCYITERIARTLHQHNSYVVNTIGYKELVRKICLASVLHCENPLQVVDDFINEYQLVTGKFFITDVKKELVDNIPTETQMGKVYCRLILQTMEEEEDYIQGMLRVYNSWITEVIDNYNTSAYYEPSYILKKAYYANSFNGL